MRSEPEIATLVGTHGLLRIVSFSLIWFVWRRAKPARLCSGWEGTSRRRCGNVGISPAVGELSKGSWEEWEACFGLSTLSTARHFHSALFQRLRQRASSASLALCMRRAAAVSLLAAACCSSIDAVIPSFSDFSHSVNDVSFSYGVR